jgi:ribose transport system ATP-binding protein
MTTIAARDVEKRFPGTRALSGVDIEIRSGEVHALLGANGSGKSTLIKILAGVLPPDRGRLTVDGREEPLRSLTPERSAELGFRFVHQGGATFPGLSVAENVMVGRRLPRSRGGAIDWRATRRMTAATLRRFRIRAAPDQVMGQLRPAAQRMVMIARVFEPDLEVADTTLVLDEPTASLPPGESRSLRELLRAQAEEGAAILYVTHRLDELDGFADRATVLRDGRVVGTAGSADMSHGRLVEAITGAAIEPADHRPSIVAASDRTPVLRVGGLRGGPIRSIDLDVDAGEIVGVAGLVGSGRSSLLRLLSGLAEPDGGVIHIDGSEPRRTGSGLRQGVAYIPEDRAAEAAFLNLSLADNLHAASLDRFWRGLRLQPRRELSAARQMALQYGIKAASPRSPFKTLSGGNQQKAIMARWLVRSPKVLLLDEPSQGVDVRARWQLHAMIKDAVGRGGCALVASSDFDELAVLCTSVIVMVRGAVVARLSGPDWTVSDLERLSHEVMAA